MKIHVGNVINRPPRQNTAMFRVLTSFIFKGIEWGFRKYMSTKIPGMVNQGLLVPQGLSMFVVSYKRKFVHELLVNRLYKLVQENVVR